MEALWCEKNTRVAVKFVKKDHIPNHGYFHGPKFPGLRRIKEAEMLRVLDHPCIVKLLDTFEDDIYVYIVSIIFPLSSYSILIHHIHR